ncbi:hypothetical protein BH09DEP1_BH09DEP1_6720 [soil metagenome]
MKFRALLFISFLPLFLNGMELSEEFKSLEEYIGQEEWQSPAASGWKPWESAMPAIVDHYKSAYYLQAIPECYESIQVGAFDEPAIYTPQYLTQKSQEHVTRLKLIIGKFGWPTKKNFGKKSAQGACIIALHADHDPKSQKKALKHLGKLRDTISLQNYAYLFDKILVNQGKPQHFGTQVDSKGQLYAINGYCPDPENWPENELQLEVINGRRAASCLPTLQESQEKMLPFFDSIRLLNWRSASPSN